MKTTRTARIGGVAAAAVLVALGVVVGAAGPANAYSIGQFCPGAQIGMRATDPAGKAIICDSDYSWHTYHGQVPHDEWVYRQNHGR